MNSQKVHYGIFIGTLIFLHPGCKNSKNLSETVSVSKREAYFYNDLSPFRCTLEGAFLSHFPSKAGDQVPGEFDDFPATLTFDNVDSHLTPTVKGNARVRGQASLTVCTFPKLEFRSQKESTKSTSPFYYDERMKISTHCGESESIASYGKYVGEKAVYREAFVYALMSALGIPGLHARPAMIQYIDSPSHKRIGPKKAFALESAEALAERLNWKLIKSKDETWPISYYRRLDRRQLALIHMFNVLIGNSDYGVFVRGEIQTQNILLFEDPRTAIVPVSYDFDLAILVTGKILDRPSSVEQPAVYTDPTAENSLADIKKRLDRLKSLLNPEEIALGIQYFTDRIKIIGPLLELFPLEAEDKTKIMLRSNAFEQALSTYKPLLQNQNKQLPTATF